jgi:hypothetical protein
MRTYRVEKTLSEDGVLELRALPFRAGDIVEIIILSREDRVYETQDFPLRGKCSAMQSLPNPWRRTTGKSCHDLARYAYLGVVG